MEVWIAHSVVHYENKITPVEQHTYEVWATQKQATKAMGEIIKSIKYDVSIHVLEAAHRLVDDGHVEIAMNLMNNWEPTDSNGGADCHRYMFRIRQSKFRGSALE